MDSLMQFVQVDAGGRPVALDEEPEDESMVLDLPWSSLRIGAEAFTHPTLTKSVPRSIA